MAASIHHSLLPSTHDAHPTSTPARQADAAAAAAAKEQALSERHDAGLALAELEQTVMQLRAAQVRGAGGRRRAWGGFWVL
jgi:hypothetical protein